MAALPRANRRTTMTRTRAVVVCRLSLTLVVVTLAVATIASAKERDVTKPEGDWPLFRGNPLQTGVAASTLPDRLRVRWKFQTGDAVEGTAAIAGGTVYVGSYDKHIHALDLKSGRSKWKYEGGPFKAPVA